MRMGLLTNSRFLYGLAILMVFTFKNYANAADIKRIEKGLGQRDVITFYGEIVAGDDKKFLNAALQSDDAVVLLGGPGGLVRVGLEIGKIIRLKGFSTAVVSGSCESACAIAWLGGLTRLMSSNGKVGFHAAYRVNKDGSASESGRANALVGAYLNNLGLPEKAIDYITSAPPESMRLLNREDAQRFGIQVVFYDNAPKTANASTEAVTDSTTKKTEKSPAPTNKPKMIPTAERSPETKTTDSPIQPKPKPASPQVVTKNNTEQKPPSAPKVYEVYICRGPDAYFWEKAELRVNGRLVGELKRGELTVKIPNVSKELLVSVKSAITAQIDYEIGPTNGKVYLLVFSRASAFSSVYIPNGFPGKRVGEWEIRWVPQTVFDRNCGNADVQVWKWQ